MRDALLPIEVVFVVRTQHGIGESKRARKLLLETLLHLGLPPAMWDPDKPVRHAVADADLDLDATGRTLDGDPFPLDDASPRRGREAHEEHRLGLPLAEFGNVTPAGL